MITTTKDQRIALKRIYNRAPIVIDGAAATYKQFRKTVQPTFGMDHAVVVRWMNMWLAIERDGYTHS
jgi:hypothetical protein